MARPDEIVADLQILAARREDLMADWVRGVNRLRELLAGIFPSLERAFDDSTRSALIHTQALITLARRLVDLIWALLRDGREFHNSPPIKAQAA